MKSLLIFSISLSLMFPSIAVAQVQPTIIIDQVDHTVTITDSTGYSTSFPAITGKIPRRLDPGEYKFTDLPSCIMEGDKCKLFSDGYYHPVEKDRYSSLGPWGSPNKAVELLMFFEQVSLDGKPKRVPPVIKGVDLQTGFHSTFVSKKKAGGYTQPDDTVKGANLSEGCVRLGKSDIYGIYTFAMLSYEARLPIKIIVKR
jgi:hypothetical protein